MTPLALLCVLLFVCAACGVSPAPKQGVAANPGPLRLVGLGDSVMAGTHCSCSGIPAEYAAALGRRTGRRVVSTNLGANGLITGDLLRSLHQDPATQASVRAADVVLLDIGANDLLPQLRTWKHSSCGPHCFRRPADEMGDRVAQIVSAIDSLRRQSPGTVLVLNYWNVFTDGAVARREGGQQQLDWSAAVTASANGAICRAAAANGARCIDTVAPFKGDGSGDPTRLLAPDGDHPDAAGVRRIVSALLEDTPRTFPAGS